MLNGNEKITLWFNVFFAPVPTDGRDSSDYFKVYPSKVGKNSLV